MKPEWEEVDGTSESTTICDRAASQQHEPGRGTCHSRPLMLMKPRLRSIIKRHEREKFNFAVGFGISCLITKFVTTMTGSLPLHQRTKKERSRSDLLAASAQLRQTKTVSFASIRSLLVFPHGMLYCYDLSSSSSSSSIRPTD